MCKYKKGRLDFLTEKLMTFTFLNKTLSTSLINAAIYIQLLA